MRDIVIYGTGGCGREIAWLVEEINKVQAEWNILGFVDDKERLHGKEINGYPVLGGREWIARCTEERPLAVALGIGSPSVKEKIVASLAEVPVEYPVLVHPSVIRSELVSFGRGTTIGARAVLTCNIEIDEFVTIHYGCTIGHDARIEKYVTLLPGCNISGNVLVKQGADIGTNSAVIQGLEVGRYTVVGAGATVVRHLPDHCTAVGTPAKPIKFHEE